MGREERREGRMGREGRREGWGRKRARQQTDRETQDRVTQMLSVYGQEYNIRSK